MAVDRALIEGYMKEAIAMGELAIKSDETPVACVFVYENRIIAKAMNDTNRSLNGTRHAEFVGIEKIMKEFQNWSSVFSKTDLYVTVEPCIMCASALRQLGIRTVYYGASNDKFGGTGGVLNIHDDPGVDPPYPVHGGIFRAEAIMLLRRFYIQENEKGLNPFMVRLEEFVFVLLMQKDLLAPEPHGKKNRQLKTEILPLVESTTSSPV